MQISLPGLTLQFLAIRPFGHFLALLLWDLKHKKYNRLMTTTTKGFNDSNVGFGQLSIYYLRLIMTESKIAVKHLVID